MRWHTIFTSIPKAVRNGGKLIRYAWLQFVERRTASWGFFINSLAQWWQNIDYPVQKENSPKKHSTLLAFSNKSAQSKSFYYKFFLIQVNDL